MPRKTHTPEEIVAKLRQFDVLTAQGRTLAEAVKSIDVSEVTLHRRTSSPDTTSRQHGGLDASKRTGRTC